MEEKQDTTWNPFGYLIDSFWASLPEKTADELATFKKDVLKEIRSAVDSFIDQEIYWTDQHLENARRMREQYRHKQAENIPPNPA
jgi:hypothetical protein